VGEAGRGERERGDDGEAAQQRHAEIVEAHGVYPELPTGHWSLRSTIRM
jgi:hypothetical protein